MAINNKLKAFVRYDGNNRIIAGSLILQAYKPKDGDWKEIAAQKCCTSSNTGILLQEDGDSLLQEDSSEILL